MYRYSSRLPWNSPANRFTEALGEVRRSGKPLLDLTVTNPTEVLADYPHQRIAEALGEVRNFRYEPDPLGMASTRAAIASWMKSRDASRVALTASTSEAYAVLFKMLADPGDEVLIPSPSYPLFECLAQLESVRLVPYRLEYDGSWFLDFLSLERAVTERTRAVIVVSPNNPTGSFLKKSEFARLRDFVRAHELPIIADEVFRDYGFSESSNRLWTLNGIDDVLSFTLNGLSKAAAMPQMKLAWITVNGPAAERGTALARLELLLDTYLSVGTPVQAAAERLLSIGDELRVRIAARTRFNLESLKAILANTPIHPLHVEAGWSVILRVPSLISEEQWVMRLLEDHDVVVQPGYFFDMPGEAFLVVSLLTEPGVFKEGLTRMLMQAVALTRS